MQEQRELNPDISKLRQSKLGALYGRLDRLKSKREKFAGNMYYKYIFPRQADPVIVAFLMYLRNQNYYRFLVYKNS